MGGFGANRIQSANKKVGIPFGTLQAQRANGGSHYTGIETRSAQGAA